MNTYYTHTIHRRGASACKCVTTTTTTPTATTTTTTTNTSPAPTRSCPRRTRARRRTKRGGAPSIRMRCSWLVVRDRGSAASGCRNGQTVSSGCCGRGLLAPLCPPRSVENEHAPSGVRGHGWRLHRGGCAAPPPSRCLLRWTADSLSGA